MDVVKTLKDAITFVQKSDNVDMLQKLTQVKQEVIDMEDQIYNLKAENRELKEKINMKDKIERYRNVPIITLKDDKPAILYCAICYGSEDKLIPLEVVAKRCYCRHCDHYCYVNYSPDNAKLEERTTYFLD